MTFQVDTKKNFFNTKPERSVNTTSLLELVRREVRISAEKPIIKFGKVVNVTSNDRLDIQLDGIKQHNIKNQTRTVCRMCCLQKRQKHNLVCLRQTFGLS